jgi:ubiquinone/menaquinone biosynthesis C-methylase UbiE
MTSISTSRGELEPPPWLYQAMARGPLFRLVYRRIIADLAATLPRGARLLDVGTGPGYLLSFLAQQRPDLQLFGLDLSYGMIRRAQGRTASFRALLVADAVALPFAPDVFDQALATFSFHNWRNPERGVGEIQRVLRPRGRAWIYELRRETARPQLRAFAREERLPFPLVYLGFKALSWHHGLAARDFAATLQQLPPSQWRLSPAHHLFWRAEIQRA